MFERVALFEIRGTDARVAYVRESDLQASGESLSLLAQTPLRWTIESRIACGECRTITGWGQRNFRNARHRLTRAFAILPLVIDNRLEALAYADNQGSPLPLTAVSKFLKFVKTLSEILGKPTVEQTRKVQSHRPRTTISRKELERARRPRPQTLETPVVQEDSGPGP